MDQCEILNSKNYSTFVPLCLSVGYQDFLQRVTCRYLSKTNRV